MLRALASAVALCVLAVSPIAAQTWKSLNGPEGGNILHVDAAGPLAAALTEAAMWISTDGGTSWRLSRRVAGVGNRVATLHVVGEVLILQDEAFSTTISLDQGNTWQPLTLPVAGVPIRAAEGSAARLFLSLAETPRGLGTLYTSDNLGESWTPSSLPGRAAGPVVIRGSEVIAETGDEILDGFALRRTAFRSMDSGVTWSPLGHEWEDFAGLVGAPLPQLTRIGNILLAGPSVSRDAGATWEPIDLFFALRNARCPGGECELSAPTLFFTREAAYIHTVINYFDDDGPEGWFLFRSTDLTTWQEISTGALPHAFVGRSTFAQTDRGVLSGSLMGMFRADASGGGWVRSETGLAGSDVFAMAATDDTIVANIVNTSRVARYRPAPGAVWTDAKIFPNLAPESSLVLELFSPDGSQVFSGHQTVGIARSIDDGAAWQFSGTGIGQYNGTAGQQFREIEAFTTHGSLIFAGSGRGLEHRSDGGQGFVITGGGVFRSADGGLTWQSASTGLPIISRDSFFQPQFDPILTMTSAGQALLAGQMFSGVARSINDGAGWTLSNTGLPMLSPTIVNGAINVLHTVGPDVFLGLQILDLTTPPMFKSSDGGQTWSPAAAGLPAADITAIAVVRGDLFASVSPGPWDSVFRSTDGGQSWSPAGTGLGGIRVRELSVLRGELYAATAGAGVWRLGCRADFDSSGVLSLQDLFDFLFAWFAQEPAADIDGSGAVGVQDVFDYLVAYFQGC